MSHSEYLKKFNRCLYEYTNAAGAFDLDEAGEDNNDTVAPVENPDMGMDGQDASAMPSDPAMGGNEQGMTDNMGADGGAVPPDGENPQSQPPEGFSPQGGNPNGGMDGMGGQPTEGEDIDTGADDEDNEDEEVIDVDDLTKAQEKAEEKIDKMNARFDILMKGIETLIKQNKERDERAAEREKAVEAEIEKRIPTPMQRLSMRSTKSSPYSMTPNEYMSNYAPENYSDADDNNGADDPQYKITKSDIDNFTDYNSIARDLDIEHQGLKDILGY